jgi:PAS domain-containing protein
MTEHVSATDMPLRRKSRRTLGVSASWLEASFVQSQERILILAPETDAQVISAAATEGGFAAEIVADAASVRAAIGEGAGAVVLVDAELSPADIGALREALEVQPSWSDLLLILVSADVERDEGRQRMRRLVELLGPSSNLHLLERPLESWMLVAGFSAALRSRRRQYAARARMDEAELQRRRELTLLASLPVGIVVVDAAGRLIETNAALQRIWGPLPAVGGVGGVADFSAFKARRADSGLEWKPFEWRVSRVLTTGQAMIEEELEIEGFDGTRRTILSSALRFAMAQGTSRAPCASRWTSPSAHGRSGRGRSWRRRPPRSSSRLTSGSRSAPCRGSP